MSDSFEILAPGMVAVPEVLNELRFETAGEALALFSMIFPGATRDSLADLPEYAEGIRSLHAKGVLKAEVTAGSVNISVDLTPLQVAAEEEGGAR